jgi:class 3 adenylate cyclase/CHASE2 domain-containing sensor protein
LAPMLVPAVVVALVCVVAAIERTSPGMVILERWEHDTYDWRCRQALDDNAPAATNLASVFIDNYSLETFNEAFQLKWPWPTVIHANMVRELGAQNAKGVAFDVLFAEKDMGEGFVDLPNDVYFAQQMSNANNVVLASFGELGANGIWTAEPPHDLLRTNAYSIGHATADRDVDGILRRAAAFKIDPDRGKVWHMAIVMAARALEIDLEQSVVEQDRILFKDAAGETVRELPVDQDGYFYINWRLAWNDDRLLQLNSVAVFNLDSQREMGMAEHGAYLQALREEGTDLPGDSPFDGRLVFIGSTASGNNVSDVGATPLAEETFLVSKHWNIANSMMMGSFIKRSSLKVDLALIVMLGMVVSVLTRRLGPPWSSLAMAGVGAVYFFTAVQVFLSSRYWMPIILPEVGGVFLPHIALICYQVVFEQKEKRRVKGVFSKLVSPNVVHELLSSDQLNFGGQRTNITVMFSDVRGFTSMTDEYHKRAEAFREEHAGEADRIEEYSDRMAQESLANVNIYLGAISNMVKKHNGTLDKYMGDCVMAFWGAPTVNEQHALSCVRAAVDGQRAMYKLNLERMAENRRREQENEERFKRGEEPLDMLRLLALGSGINTGVCIVGLMGSEQHILNYTVFGREVNLASRLEAVSGRGRIVIGENTYNEIKSYAPEEVETYDALKPVMVKGIDRHVPIYEVPWKENWKEREALEMEIIGEVIPLKPKEALVYEAKPKAQSLDDA